MQWILTTKEVVFTFQFLGGQQIQLLLALTCAPRNCTTRISGVSRQSRVALTETFTPGVRLPDKIQAAQLDVNFR